MQTPLTTDSWPIDYTAVLAWRQRQVILMRQVPELAVGAAVVHEEDRR